MNIQELEAEILLNNIWNDHHHFYRHYYLSSHKLAIGTNSILKSFYKNGMRMDGLQNIVRKTFWEAGHLSTVFLPVNYSYRMDMPPLIFETMDFGFPLSSDQQRYSTWKQAVQGHYKWRQELIADHGTPVFEHTKNRRNTKFISYHFECGFSTNIENYVRIGYCPHCKKLMRKVYNHSADNAAKLKELMDNFPYSDSPEPLT